jgi:hypothetical protein
MTTRPFILLFPLIFLPGILHAEDEDSLSVANVLERILGKNRPALGVLAQVQSWGSVGGTQAGSGFSIPNLRLDLTGPVVENFRYHIEGNFAGSFTLLNARFFYNLTDELRFQAGQFKPPFGGEFLLYEGGLRFIKRSQAAQLLNPGYQQGVSVEYSGLDSRLSLAGGAFNGRNDDYFGRISLYAARISIIPLKIGGGDSTTMLTIMGSVLYSGDPELRLTFYADRDVYLYHGGIRFERNSFWIEGEYIAARRDGDIPQDGFYADVGTSISRNVEVAARFDWLRDHWLSAFQSPRIQRAYIVGVNWYPSSPIKVQFQAERNQWTRTTSGIIKFQYRVLHGL